MGGTLLLEADNWWPRTHIWWVHSYRRWYPGNLMRLAARLRRMKKLIQFLVQERLNAVFVEFWEAGRVLP